ncbi:tetratricopeptide repeat protein [Mucilaginibacter sp. HMF5004]|uniref:tetratricopeptide repeat protein n=1 Tax=Mucilaginibacter rivuli TaxID=2857527 RepID=UPI001C5D6BD5|nr:tetratricopeptide repeat protein [Mucilaginibacter rivuli]MBW4891909.1 tetratricopeptide repeat protein [Mucilaginibacter rivuli]
MKIKILMIGLVSLVSVSSVFAQKGELTNAQEQYNKYMGLYKQKNFAVMATTAITDAKTSIDKAAANDKTATLPLTYAVKGAIYAALAYRDTVPSTQTPLFATAEEALTKAKAADTKAENKKLIDDAYQTLIVIKYNLGVKQYQGGKYEAAYNSFDFFRSVRPDDTSAIYLTGLSATNAKMYDEAIKNYKKLLTTNYSKNPTVYSDLSYIYLSKKDTATAIKIVEEGALKFPNDGALSKREIELNLQTGKAKEVIAKIEKAVAADPKNKTLYYYAGLAYNSAGNLAKAEESYRKAIEIDPNYFEATLNLGYVLLSPAITLNNAANKLPANKQKEYDETMKKASAAFDLAKPVLLKAVELRPTSYDALYNLKNCYLGKKDFVNATATQKKIDALK